MDGIWVFGLDVYGVFDAHLVSRAYIHVFFVQTLSREDGVVLQHIWLLIPRTVPKTTSGKIARKWCQVSESLTYLGRIRSSCVVFPVWG